MAKNGLAAQGLAHLLELGSILLDVHTSKKTQAESGVSVLDGVKDGFLLRDDTPGDLRITGPFSEGLIVHNLQQRLPEGEISSGSTNPVHLFSKSFEWRSRCVNSVVTHVRFVG